jgi:hypothetical protein
MNRKNADRF